MDTSAQADGSPGHLVTSFVSLVAGSVVVRVLAFVASVFVTGAVGPTDFGTLAFGLTLAMLFALCVNFGLDAWLVREIARAPGETDEIVGHAVLLRLVAVPVGLGRALSLGPAGHTSWLLTIWLVAFGVLHSYMLLVCAVFRGRGRQRVQAILLSTQMGLIAAASITATWLTGSVVLVAAGYAGASALSLAIGYALLLRERVRPGARSIRPASMDATPGTPWPGCCSQPGRPPSAPAAPSRTGTPSSAPISPSTACSRRVSSPCLPPGTATAPSLAVPMPASAPSTSAA